MESNSSIQLFSAVSHRPPFNFDVRLLHLLFAILWYFDAVAQSTDRFSKQRNSRVVSRTKGTNGDGALTEQWSGCAPIRSFLRVNRDLHRNRIITRFALGKELGRCSPLSLSPSSVSMRFEDEKNFLLLRIHFYSIPFARLIDNLLSRIRRKNKLIVLKYKYRRYILLFKKLTMNVFIASQTNRRKFVYVRNPLKLLRIRTTWTQALYRSSSTVFFPWSR